MKFTLEIDISECLEVSDPPYRDMSEYEIADDVLNELQAVLRQLELNTGCNASLTNEKGEQIQ